MANLYEARLSDGKTYNVTTERHPRAAVGVLIAALLGIGVAPGLAQTQPTPHAPLSDVEIQQGRARLLNDMLTGDMPGVARWSRQSCAFHDSGAEVAKARAEGRVTAPDAGAGCVAALTWQAYDGALVALYQDTLNLRTGSIAGADALPQRIVDAIRSGITTIDIGGGRSLDVTPGLAFDAGFTAAYWDGAAAQQASIDPTRLTTMTENCVSQRGNLKQCFAMGYVQGTSAYQAAHRVTAR